MAIDFTTRSPWKDITELTVDGCAVVRIPKFYYKVTGDYASTIQWSIADKATTGYTVHPAFMHNGIEQDYFDMFAYEAYQNGTKAGSASGKTPWVRIAMDAAITACGNIGLGWHLQNIYEHSAIAMLMLVEEGTADMQTAIGTGNSSNSTVVSTGTTDAKWRGIHELWGNTWEWCDGIYTNGSGISILKTDGSGKYVNVSKSVDINSGNFATTLLDKGTDYDFSSVFIPTSTGNAVYPDYAYVNTSDTLYPWVSGNYGYGASCGAFYFHCGRSRSLTNGSLSFRAAHYAN